MNAPRLAFRLIRGVSLAVFIPILMTAARAGDIVGRVSDGRTGSYLPGVVVELDGKNLATVSESDGSYRLTNVAPGRYTVRATYLGADAKSASVTVPASGNATADLTLGSEVMVLSAVTVEGYREGRSRAMYQKQTADNITDVISADSVGNLPDRNVAEAVARVAGVNLSLEQGEGRYVSIRGVEPNLNQVLLDGATMAAPGGTRLGRAVPLDTLGTAQISQIEVIKSVTPDLDANSLGGTLNIKSASPFDRTGRFVSGSLALNRNETTGKNNLEGRLAFSDTFGPGNKWGLAASASYDQRDYSNHWVQTGWNLRNIGGNNLYLPNAFEIKPEEGNLKRWGGNLALEYRPDENTQFYLRPNFSTTSRFEHTVEVIHSVDNSPARVTMTSPTAGVFAGAGVRTERRDFRGVRDQDLFSLSGGFKKTLGDFVLEPMVSYSAAKEVRDFDRILAFRNANGGTGPITFDISNLVFPRWEVDPAIDIPSKYTLRRTRDDDGLVDEKTLTAKVDLRWNSDKILGRPGFLKTGFKYLQRERTTDLESRRLVPVGNWNLSAIGVLPPVRVYDGRYDSGFLLNHFPTWAYLESNPALTVVDPVDSAANSIEDDYMIDEYIYAAYAMANLKINQLTLLGGMRYEKTDATIRAVEARFAGSALLGRFPTSGTTSYDKFFPNLQAIYRFTNRLLLRGAFTQTLGRPAYEDARPLANFRYDPLGAAALTPAFPFSGTLNVGNPKLGPYQAKNYDLSLEWYAKGGGVISVAAFRKEVTDPIYTFSEVRENLVHSGISLQTLAVTSVRNAKSGRISGLEFNLYQPFRFLPAPFNGLGFDGNLTFITSSVSIPTRPGEDIPFFRQPGKIANATLFYEQGRFSGRIAWIYADGQIRTLGTNPLADRYLKAREQYDVQCRFRINSRYSITAAVRNLTREPEQLVFGVKNLLQSSRLLDQDYKLGVSFNY